MKNAYHKIHKLLTDRCFKPSLHILDNACPNVLKTFIREINENLQLVHPHIHHRNSAEQAIRTFKEHFISRLSSIHKYFPLNQWCRLLPHANLTINLLPKLCMNPKLSGYVQLHGEFNYNATLLSLPGTQVIIHEKSTVIGTWVSHGVKGWYIGPSMDHYRCHRVYFTKTRGEWDSDCVEFSHTILHSPTIIPQKISSSRRMNWPMP